MQVVNCTGVDGANTNIKSKYRDNKNEQNLHPDGGDGLIQIFSFHTRYFTQELFCINTNIMSKCQDESCATSPTVMDYRSIFDVIHLTIVESTIGNGPFLLSSTKSEKHYSKQSTNLVLTIFHTHSRQTLTVTSYLYRWGSSSVSNKCFNSSISCGGISPPGLFQFPNIIR